MGKVVQIGKNVKNCAIGDIVGVGWQKESCHNCEWCEKGEENLCSQNKGTCTLGSQGGFSNKWCGDSEFCFKVPEGLPLKFVGPLMCGGITVFSPLKRWAKPGHNVGVIGIGGLGHMAIKFAKAKGCKVTAFSRSNAKVSKHSWLKCHFGVLDPHFLLGQEKKLHNHITTFIVI